MSKLSLYTVELITLFMPTFEDIRREIGITGVMNPLGIYPDEFDGEIFSREKDPAYQ